MTTADVDAKKRMMRLIQERRKKEGESASGTPISEQEVAMQDVRSPTPIFPNQESQPIIQPIIVEDAVMVTAAAAATIIPPEKSKVPKKPEGATQTARGIKRKTPSSPLSFPESKIWPVSSADNIGPLIASLDDKEWGEEARVMGMWQTRNAIMLPAITYFREELAKTSQALKEAEAEKDKVIAASKVAIATKEGAYSQLAQSYAQLKEKNEQDITSWTSVREGLQKEKDALQQEKDALQREKERLEGEKKEWEEDKKNWADEKMKLEKEKAELEDDVIREAELTQQNLKDQVRLLNPAVKLDNVHYFHFVKNGKLMRLNPDTQAEELVELVSFMDTGATTNALGTDDSDARNEEEGPIPMIIHSDPLS